MLTVPWFQIFFSNRCDVHALSNEREKLMKKLIEVEMDGQAAVKQVNEMREAFRRLREVSLTRNKLWKIKEIIAMNFCNLQKALSGNYELKIQPSYRAENID